MTLVTDPSEKVFHGGDQKLMGKMQEAISGFLSEAHRLFVRTWKNPALPDAKRHPPQIFLTVDEDEIDYSETVIVVEIRRKDRNDPRTGRVSLSLSRSDVSGNIAACLRCPRKDDDPQRDLKVTFVDWDKVGAE